MNCIKTLQGKKYDYALQLQNDTLGLRCDQQLTDMVTTTSATNFEKILFDPILDRHYI